MRLILSSWQTWGFNSVRDCYCTVSAIEACWRALPDVAVTVTTELPCGVTTGAGLLQARKKVVAVQLRIRMASGPRKRRVFGEPRRRRKISKESGNSDASASVGMPR